MIAWIAASAIALAVFPSAASVPERLLRVTIVFRAPADETLARTAGVRRGNGRTIVAPFVDPPLWSADRRTLTLLFDPSRQKSGLRNHVTDGYVLPAGDVVSLVLGGRTIKRWRVHAGGCPPLDPHRWSSTEPRAGSRDALVVRFGAPVDVVSRDRVAVADGGRRRLPGADGFFDAERAWRFVPDHPWPQHASLAVHPRLEDPCGDEIGEAFEHRSGQGLGTDRQTLFLPLSRMRGHAIVEDTTRQRAPDSLGSNDACSRHHRCRGRHRSRAVQDRTA